MRIRRFRWTLALSLSVLAVSTMASAQQPNIGIAPIGLGAGPYLFDTAEQHGIRVDVVVRGLAHPFSFAFLPNGDALIVERGANVRMVKSATGDARLVPEPVAGAPAPAGFRGGGLHDIAIHPEFATNNFVYFTYNAPGPPDPTSTPPGRRPVAVTLARARFDGVALNDAEDLFVGEMLPGSSGSRIAFAPNGYVFMTTGAPFNDSAQRLDNVYGKVLRLTLDGGIPADNPFVGQPGARGEIYTLGHRDQLGLAVDPVSGAVVAAEHGPNGGDEVNLILPGRNYGWPEYSYGRTYEGPRHSRVPLGPDTEQ
ncbi:MAG TPA: PQQ-dependent sugar dehydrogenase, partial [Gammaproteobacteria bacterium]